MQTLSSLIAGYLETDEYEKQLSPDTIKAYRIDLRQFLDFTGGEWADKDVLNQYIKYLNQHFAPRSAKRKLASIRAFYHEMEMCGKLEENPFDKLHIRIHSPQQLPRVIPEQVVQALLQSAYNAYAPGCREVLRDIVVLELLFSTGLRVSELCALSKDTFLLNDSGLRLLVKGKGRKERILQITTPGLLQVVQTYCDMFSKEIQEQGAILFNQRGRPLSPQSVRRIINKYLNRIGESIAIIKKPNNNQKRRTNGSSPEEKHKRGLSEWHPGGGPNCGFSSSAGWLSSWTTFSQLD